MYLRIKRKKEGGQAIQVVLDNDTPIMEALLPMGMLKKELDSTSFEKLQDYGFVVFPIQSEDKNTVAVENEQE